MSESTQQTTFDLSVLRCAAGTDVGLRREENQDAFGVIQTTAFHGFFVADGMGGVSGGAIASRIAIATLEEKLPPLGAGISSESISAIVEGINSAIFEQGAAQPALAGMGTTLVGVVFTPLGMISLNVGDSRLYRVRAGKIKQISEDHTLVRELVRSGAISNKDASHHPVSHMLTRSLGPLAEVLVECRREPEPALEDDIYILCSDGLYNFVSDAEILDVVRQNPLDDANQILINLANRRGGTDNITVIVVSVGEFGGRRRGSEYRKARTERSSGAALEDASSSAGRVDSGAGSVEESYPHPPRVEEPRDYHAERESIKERNKSAPHRPQNIPVPLLVCGAVLFGLIVGDVGRRWGAFPDFIAIMAPFSSGRGLSDSKEPNRFGSRLNDVSKELALSITEGRPSEGLPDIARRVSGGGGAGSISVGRKFRRDLDSLNKTALQSAAAKVEVHLRELTSPPSSSAVEALKTAERGLVEYSRELTEAETQIDTASRKLSLWFGRKKKAEESQSDLFTPGGEVERVGAISERVKRKAAEWTEATYQLQAKQDEFELHPGNEGLRREVDALQNNRSNLQLQLREEVLAAIDGVLADTYRQLEELKARRDIAAARVSTAQDEVDFLRILTGPDEGPRDEARKRLQEELEEIRGALSQMR